MRAMLGLFEAARGEALDTIEAELRETAGDRPDAEDEWLFGYVGAEAAISRGDLDAAYRLAMTASELDVQAPEDALRMAQRAAVWSRNVERVREVHARWERLPWHGIFAEAVRLQFAAGVAALEGRRDDAMAAFREARASLERMEQQFAAARVSLDAIILLPDEPEVRSWSDGARATFDAVRARPYLEKLDEALASARAPAQSRSESRAETPTA